MVAKSYQDLKKLGEPYTKNGRQYIMVELKSGKPKEVRFYSEKEYLKMYPEERNNIATKTPVEKEVGYFHNLSQKKILGFGEAGYINVIVGETEPYEKWLSEQGATYTRWWNWSFASNKEVPELPSALKIVKLAWEAVGVDDIHLKNEDELELILSNILCPDYTSEFQGEAGDKIEKDLTIVKCIVSTNTYGVNYYHIMIDNEGNEYAWNTSARQLKEGASYKVSGKIKELKVVKGKRVTILTRCKAI